MFAQSRITRIRHIIQFVNGIEGLFYFPLCSLRLYCLDVMYWRSRN
jgi:hypothetical protein